MEANKSKVNFKSIPQGRSSYGVIMGGRSFDDVFTPSKLRVSMEMKSPCRSGYRRKLDFKVNFFYFSKGLQSNGFHDLDLVPSKRTDDSFKPVFYVYPYLTPFNHFLPS